jgi:hypothetical protein
VEYLQARHCNPIPLKAVRIGQFNDVLTTLYKVMNIERTVRPVGPRDILLSGKRDARVGEFGRLSPPYHKNLIQDQFISANVRPSTHWRYPASMFPLVVFGKWIDRQPGNDHLI